MRDPERGLRDPRGPRRHEARDAVDLGRLARCLAGEVEQEGLRDAAVLRERAAVGADDVDVVPARARDLERAQVALADAPRRRVAPLHGGRPGRERVFVPVADEDGHELVERCGAGRPATLGAGGGGLVLGDDQPEAARLRGVGDGGRAAGTDAPDAGSLARGVGLEAADGHGAGDSVRGELAGHGEHGQRDRHLERARVPAGGQGRFSVVGGFEAHVGADAAHAEPLQRLGDGCGSLLRFGVSDAGDVKSSGLVGVGGHREDVPVDPACVRAVDLHLVLLGGTDKGTGGARRYAVQKLGGREVPSLDGVGRPRRVISAGQDFATMLARVVRWLATWCGRDAVRNAGISRPWR